MFLAQVWVPSQFNVDTFVASGVPREKLFVVPQVGKRAWLPCRRLLLNFVCGACVCVHLWSWLCRFILLHNVCTCSIVAEMAVACMFSGLGSFVRAPQRWQLSTTPQSSPHEVVHFHLHSFLQCIHTYDLLQLGSMPSIIQYQSAHWLAVYARNSFVRCRV